jgi:hypothetical protein
MHNRKDLSIGLNKMSVLKVRFEIKLTIKRQSHGLFDSTMYESNDK